MDELKFKPIGVIHSPFNDPNEMKLKFLTEREVEGTIEIYQDYVDGLSDLDGFSHLMIFSHFHKSKGFSPLVSPPMDNQPHGIFATRSPSRPNPIALSVVKLLKLENNIITFEGVDMIEGTLVVDIKPYILPVDWIENPKLGWLEKPIKEKHESNPNTKWMN